MAKKDSSLVGAANSASIQSAIKPSGSAKELPAVRGNIHTPSRFKQVDISNMDRNPKTDKNFTIGLNRDQYVKGMDKTRKGSNG